MEWRLHVTLKVSTEEQARLIVAALQEQWKKVGVALEVRPLEIATLFADLARGNFQISYLRWVGANNDPDVFDLVFSSKRIPPNGANRGHYRNAQVDALIDGIRAEMNREKRKELCSEVQKIVAEDVPYVPLWFTDVVSVHGKEMGEIALSPTGGYEILVGEWRWAGVVSFKFRRRGREIPRRSAPRDDRFVSSGERRESRWQDARVEVLRAKDAPA
jgi:peptide/nickel transport system substrate-binding protein